MFIRRRKLIEMLMWISRTLNRMCPFFCPGYAHVQVWSTSLMMIHHVCEFWSKCLEGNIPFYQSTSCVDVINKIIRTSSLYIKSLQYLTAHIIYNTKLPSQIITVLVCASFTLWSLKQTFDYHIFKDLHL